MAKDRAFEAAQEDEEVLAAGRKLASYVPPAAGDRITGKHYEVVDEAYATFDRVLRRERRKLAREQG